MKHFFSRQFVLFFLCLATTRLNAAAPVRVAGQVVNETHRAAASGVRVQMLHVGKNAKQQQTVATVQTDAKGRFDCGMLKLGADDLLIARAHWQGNSYDQAWVYEAGGRLKSMDATVAPSQMKLSVYDATTTTPALSFQVHHLAINAKEQNLTCIERIVVLNPSQRTFRGAGAQKVSVRLALPAGALDVKMDPDVDGKLVKTPEGWGVVKPIVPSKQDARSILKNNVIIINYSMKWPLSLPWSRHIDLSRKVVYPTSFFFVVREESDRKLEITAPQLAADKVEQVNTREGMQARIVNMMGGVGGEGMGGGPMSGGPMNGGEPALKSGDAMTIRVARPINPLVWVFVLFVVALCLVVPLSLINRRGGTSAGHDAALKQASLKTGEPVVEASVYRGTPTRAAGISSLPEEFSGSDLTLSNEARSLIEEIAKLDDNWAAGAIEAGAYQSQRAVWKRKLIDLLESKSSS